MSNTCFNLTFVLSRKLLRAVAANAAPFLCNFRANFAAAIRIGKAANAGQANVRLTYLKVGGYGTNRNSLSTEKVTQYILGKGLEKVPYKPHCVRLVTNKNNCNVKGIAEGRLK